MKPPLQLATLVWGSWHVNTFLNYTLPTILTPKNLPELAKNCSPTYLIATTEQDAEFIKNHPAYTALTKLTSIKFLIHPSETFSGKSPVAIQNQFWTTFFNLAKKEQSWLAFIAPDFIYSDQALSHSITPLFEGKSSIVLPAIRVTEETFSQQVSPSLETPHLHLSPENLSHLIIKHLHPVNTTYLEGNPHCCFHCEHLYFPTENHGLLLQSASCSVVAVNTKTLDIDHLHQPVAPGATAYITDTSKAVLASLAPLTQYTDMYTLSSPLTTKHFGQWLFNYFSQEQLNYHSQKYHYPFQQPTTCDQKVDHSLKRASDKADLALQSALTHSILQVIASTLSQNQASIFAELLMTALHTTSLAKEFPHHIEEYPLTLITPLDTAFHSTSDSSLDSLSTPENADFLKDYILSHFLPIQIAFHPKTQDLSFEINHPKDVLDSEETSITVKSISGKGICFTLDNQNLLIASHPVKHSGFEAPIHLRHILLEHLPQPIPTTPISEKSFSTSSISPTNAPRPPQPSPMPPSPLPPKSLNLFLQAQKKRQHIKLAQTTAYYAQTTNLSKKYAPYAYLVENSPELFSEKKLSEQNRIQTLLQEALQIHPDFAEAHLALAEIHLSQGFLDLALPHLQKALTTSPQLEPSSLDLPLIPKAAFYSAETYRKQVIKISSDSPDFLKKIHQAITHYRMALHHTQNQFPQAYLGLALCLQKLNQLKASRKAFLKALGARHFTPDFPKISLLSKQKN